MKEIQISEIKGFSVGHAENCEARTGCTVIICPEGAMPGANIMGGGPATRETPLAEPLKNAHAVHAVMLSGGSAFGLAASNGAMNWLEEKGIGYRLKNCIVPLVMGASIFDLAYGDGRVRPDEAMGRAACDDAWSNMKDGKMLRDPARGNVGCGTGATVGKIYGAERMMKGGLGIAALESGGIKVAAITAVNAFGDIWDGDEIIAGARDEKGGFADAEKVATERVRADSILSMENTTISCLITDAELDKCQANKVAQIAGTGFARAIKPVSTSADGDAVFVLANGAAGGSVNCDALGVVAAEAVRRSIIDAVRSAGELYE